MPIYSRLLIPKQTLRKDEVKDLRLYAAMKSEGSQNRPIQNNGHSTMRPYEITANPENGQTPKRPT